MANGPGEPTPPSVGRPGPDTEESAQSAYIPPDPPHDGLKRRVTRERDLLTHLFATLGKLLGVVVTLVTLIGAAVTLLFQVDPSVEPCIGGQNVTFRSVQVAPDYPLPQYMRDINNGQTPAGLPPLIGAEVRYSYSASNLSGHGLRLYTTLQEVSPSGDISAPPGPPPSPTSSENLQSQVGLPGQPPPVVEVNNCSQDSSGLDWVQLPQSPGQRHRYRIVLEFYRGAASVFTDRIGVGESPIFDY